MIKEDRAKAHDLSNSTFSPLEAIRDSLHGALDGATGSTFNRDGALIKELES